MKKIIPLVFICLLLISSVLQAQETSSWINYDQKYVRVGVTVKGLQKVTFSQLNNANPDLNLNISNASRLQLFHRGQEVAIVKIENEDIFFYGVLNDGASDSLLFRPITSNVNKRYSRYSDEGSYFFTLGNSNGKRSQTINTPTNNDLTALTWHWERLFVMNRNEYSNNPNGLAPSLMQSYYRDGESFTGQVVDGSTPRTITLSLTNRYTDPFISPRLEYMVNGRLEGSANNQFLIKASNNNRQIVNRTIIGFKGILGSYNEFISGDFSVSNQLALRFEGVNSTTRVSATYAYLEYPQLNTMDGSNKQFYLDPSSNQVDKIEISNVSNSSSILLDVSDHLNPTIISNATLSSNKLTAFVARTSNKKSTLLLSSNGIIPTNIKAKNFNQITPSNYNYVIITNSKLRNAVNQYAGYRASTVGGNHKVLVMDILDVYSQFNYGDPSPVAIQRFAKHIVSDNSHHKNLFLVGWTVNWHSRVPRELTGVMTTAHADFQDPSLIGYDYIPSIGYPGSDMLLVDNIGIDARENVPGMGIGRLPAITEQQVLDYLEKVTEYEDPNKDFSWRKNVLSVSGGGKNGSSEVLQLKNALDQLNPDFTSNYLGGNLTRIAKDPDSFIASTNLDISSYINNGSGIVTFYGHGNASSTDYNFGYISHNLSKYNETDKYPFLYYVGCGVSNIFSSRYLVKSGALTEVAISTDWLFAKKRGAIAVMSNTWDSYLTTAHEYFAAINKFMLTQPNIISIGEVQMKASREIATTKSVTDTRTANLHQSLLQGDPALKLVRVENSEYLTDYDEGLFITSGSENILLKDANDPKLAITVKNHGKYDSALPLNFRVRFNYKNGSNKVVNQAMPNVAIADTHYVSLNTVEGAAGRTLAISEISSIEVTLNPTNTPSEFNLNNNASRLNFDWSKAQNYPLWTSREAALPVKLVTFDIVKESNSALLNWSTTEEINSKEFSIERSQDSKNWITIGSVEAAGTTDQIQYYQFNDTQLTGDTYFYRLKMIDLDNSFDYSVIRSIVLEANASIIVYPNPSSKNIQVKSHLLQEGESQVLIQDIAGRTIFNQKATTTNPTISIDHLKAGIYILKIKSTTGIEQTIKFVKQ